MVSTQSFQQQLEAKVREIEQVVSGMSDDKASQAPAPGEWCVKEVLTHLSGSEAQSFYAGLQRFVNEETPRLDLTPGETYLTPTRENAPVDELLASVLTQYGDIGKWIGKLSDADLLRKAHMPAFKETPLSEYPTLQLWIGAIINFHLTAHVQQLQTLAK